MLTLQSYDPTGSGASAPYSLVLPIDGDLYVNSVNLAEGLGVKHKSLLETIRTYLAQIQRFGHLPFKSATVINSVGAVNETTYCLLNENQALFVGSLSRNTEKVVAFKVRLIEEFDKARRALIVQPNEALVKLVNDLMTEVVRLRQGITTSTKQHQKAYEAKVKHDLELDMDARIKREKIQTYVTTVIRRSIGGSWNTFWEQFELSYNCDIRGLEQRKNELRLDTAIRNGYLDQLWDFINIS